MKIVWSLATLALVLPFAGACSRTFPQTEPVPQSEPPVVDRACLVAIAADPGGDHDIAALQENLRAHRDAARAAEHLGYRFIARARLSNDTGDYTVAEQAAACLESIVPDEPAALAPPRSRAAPDAPLQRGGGDRPPPGGGTRVRPRLRPPRRRADGAGARGGGCGRLPEDDRPQAVLPVLYPRGASSMAQGRPRRRHRDDERRRQGAPARAIASPSPGPTRGSRCTSCSAAAWPMRSGWPTRRCSSFPTTRRRSSRGAASSLPRTGTPLPPGRWNARRASTLSLNTSGRSPTRCECWTGRTRPRRSRRSWPETDPPATLARSRSTSRRGARTATRP